LTKRKLIKKVDLGGQTKKKFKATIDSKQNLPVAPTGGVESLR